MHHLGRKEKQVFSRITEGKILVCAAKSVTVRVDHRVASLHTDWESGRSRPGCLGVWKPRQTMLANQNVKVENLSPQASVSVRFVVLSLSSSYKA